MRCAYVAYNPHAGRYPSLMLAERAADVLREQDWEIELFRTKSGMHITELARKAVSESMDAFFIVGGDGSVSLAAAGLMNSNTALGVLPAGTSNVFAQELGLPGLGWTRWLALEESARLLAEADVHFIDLGECSGHIFLLWAGIGLDGFIVHRIEPRPRWEKYFAVVHYAASAVVTASLWHGINLNFRVDGNKINGHFILAVISNIHLYAGGLATLSPQACLNDGLMDLWLFQGENLGRVVKHAWDLLAGRHIESEWVDRISFHSLEVDTESQLYIQLDAEPLLNPNSLISIRVKPKALKVLIPQKTPRPLFNADYSDFE